MIWVQHNFYENFKHSIDSRDIELSLDIFRSELSDLLTYHSSVLYGLFDKLKIKYRKKSSYEELFDIVMREIKSGNKKFINGLSYLIAEGNKTLKNNKDVAWVNVLNGITKGIKVIANYFTQNPKQEKLFKRRTLDMLGVKSSVTGDDDREVKKKDNTVLWILGITAAGIAAYLIYRHFDKKREIKLYEESLERMKSRMLMEAGGSIQTPVAEAVANVATPVTPVAPAQVPVAAVPAEMPKMASNVHPSVDVNDPAFNVPADVLMPEKPVANGNGTVQVNIQTAPTQPVVKAPVSNQAVNSSNQV